MSQVTCVILEIVAFGSPGELRSCPKIAIGQIASFVSRANGLVVGRANILQQYCIEVRLNCHVDERLISIPRVCMRIKRKLLQRCFAASGSVRTKTHDSRLVLHRGIGEYT